MHEDKEQIKLQGGGNSHHRCHFLKKTLQLVVSVAFLSFFLSHSSGFSLFPHSFYVYFSTFLFSFFTHTLERKYMFLICNGILAFLAKSSVSSSSSDLGPQISTASTNLTQTKANLSVRDEVALRFSGYDVLPPVAEGEEAAEDTCKNKVEEQGEQGNDESLGREEEEEEEERESASEVSVTVEDEDDKEGESGLVMQEGGAAVAGDEEEPSTEELNRKIEEFIRKMKEEIRIEAQRQLIAV